MNNYHALSEICECNNGHKIFISSRAIIRVDELEENNIRAILSLGEENKLHVSELEGVERYVCYDVGDSERHYAKMNALLPNTREFLTNALNVSSVLVHCTAGISRSPTVVIDFMARSELYPEIVSTQEAYDLVRAKRDCVEPNDAFMMLLNVRKD